MTTSDSAWTALTTFLSAIGSDERLRSDDRSRCTSIVSEATATGATSRRQDAQIVAIVTRLLVGAR